ncbi:uncharacterized protein LOC126355653 [Schistocerca gregaria]|uniref:uncharacterized protein LOC126355653 n=1 Tax=Schistocerca gregaria TaxID=7010 RepID=UPI00211E98DB|nr:uncharacterized protein LOC126355653 [Schistocerca gregaria]
MSALIDQVQKYPVLWDYSKLKYRDANLRDLAWEEISQVLRKPKAVVKTDWRKLRDSHRNALKRRETKSGQAAANSKKWKYEKEMEFLLSVLPAHSLHDSNIPDMDDTQVPENQIHDDSIVNAEAPAAPDDDEFSNSDHDVNTVRNKPKGVDKILKFLKNKEINKPVRSVPEELDLFFGSMSMSVKKLPRRLQNRGKREVLEAVNRAEDEHDSLMSLITPAVRQTSSPLVSPSTSSDSSTWSGGNYSNQPTILHHQNETSLTESGSLLRSLLEDTDVDLLAENYSGQATEDNLQIL